MKARKRDQSEPKIVAALEKAGWSVYRELPIDLMCMKRVGNTVRIRLLECKTAQGKKAPKARVRNDQEEQNAFCERWQIPKPTCAMEALLAVGEIVTLDP